jgi:thiamine monophosphate kinase
MLAAVSGGEDYELLFASRSEDKVERLRGRLDLPITRIGEMTDEEGVALVGRDGQVSPLSPLGWNHFGQQAV